jgi:tetratricopeptide (TPR) repeat protein
VLRHEFTNKVDIWSLGCILHEAATSKAVFEHDWAVQQFYERKDTLPSIPIPCPSDFLSHHLSEMIHELLDREPQRRPRAGTVSRLLNTFLKVSRFPLTLKYLEGNVYPKYSEWKEKVLVEVDHHITSQDMIMFMASYFSETGEGTLVADYLRSMIREGVLKEIRAVTENNFIPPSTATVLAGVIAEIGDSFVEEGDLDHAIAAYVALSSWKDLPVPFSVPRRLGDIYQAKGWHADAILIYEQAAAIRPIPFWTWICLCEVYCLQGDFDKALNICELARKDFPKHPLPGIVVSSLYAYLGKYRIAIELQQRMQFFRQNLNYHPIDFLESSPTANVSGVCFLRRSLRRYESHSPCHDE